MGVAVMPIERAVVAPAQTFEEAFGELKVAAYRVAYRILGDHGDAEDAAQEACARAYSRWRRVRGYALPWVSRVSANLALDRIRKRKRQTPEGQTSVSQPDVAVRLDLQKALDGLPKRQREVVTLRYLGDLSVQEVASVLGCGEGTVKRAAHTGLSKLRETVDLDGVFE